ncbi:MFS transporter [Marinomonas mediterranea]|uniref:MFS transporter n=1 Tax=Marinomonas mediterranea TaxID=119864 RepID=UPI00234B3548|nr:MFS transporter [Marinomonas mediterranea]WCN07674.1 MFS transporter [Marinomonas mediterranea]
MTSFLKRKRASDNLINSNVSDNWIILSLVLGSILPLLDSTALGVAIPSLSQYFSVSVHELQKIVTFYTLAAAVTVPLCAWGMKRYNTKCVWLSGLCLFLLSSAACATADSLNQLTAYRIVQGIGAGVLMSAMQPILLNALGREQFRSAMAKVAIPAVVVPIFGPFVAGGILELTSWHWIFLINVPISIGALIFALCFVPNCLGNRGAALDLTGYLTFALALGSLVYVLSSISSSNREFYLSWDIFCFTFICIACFCFYIFHTLRRSESAVLDIALFAGGQFRNTAILLFLSSFAFYAGLFILPSIFVQSYDYSVLLSSSMLGIGGVGALLSRFYLSRLSSVFSTANVALIGTLFGVLGTAPLLFPLVFDSSILVGLCMLIRGAALGLLTLLAMTNLYVDITKEKTPDVSAWSRVLTLLGGSIGTALMGVLFHVDIFGFPSMTIVALLAANTICLIPAFSLNMHKNNPT